MMKYILTSYFTQLLFQNIETNFVCSLPTVFLQFFGKIGKITSYNTDSV